MGELRAHGPWWLDVAAGFCCAAGAVAGVLLVGTMLFAMSVGSDANFGTLALAAASIVLVAFGPLPESASEMRQTRTHWSLWIAGALILVGSAWCLSDPWRGAPPNFLALAYFSWAAGALPVALFFFWGASQRQARTTRRLIGQGLGLGASLAVFWPWATQITERIDLFLAAPTRGAGAEILSNWILLAIMAAILLTLAGYVWAVDRCIEANERRNLMRAKAN